MGAWMDVCRWGSLAEPANAVSWPLTWSPGDFFVVTHLTDQPFPVISLKLLGVKWYLGWHGPGAHHQSLVLC